MEWNEFGFLARAKYLFLLHSINSSLQPHIQTTNSGAIPSFSRIPSRVMIKYIYIYIYMTECRIIWNYREIIVERVHTIFIGGRLEASYYRSRVDHCWKIRSREIRTDVGKLSFVNRTIADWNRLHEGSVETSLIKTHVFRKRVRKVYQWGEVKGGYMVGIAQPI
jgi:hypothetical protein